MYQLAYDKLAHHICSTLGTRPPRLLVEELASFNGVVLVAPYDDPDACDLIDEIAPRTPMFGDGTCMICLASEEDVQEHALQQGGIAFPGWPRPPEGGEIRAIFLRAVPTGVEANVWWLPRADPEKATDEPTPWRMVVMGNGVRFNLVSATHGPHCLPLAAATPRPKRKRRANLRKARRSKSR
jgi:hypothetical protein